MTASPAALVIETYGETHELILRFLGKMTDEQLRWQLTPRIHSIAWHAWHLARWTDYTQAAIPGMTPELGRRLGTGVQIWQRDGLAAQWGFDPAQLGYAETGMYMADDAATAMKFPPKERLLDYVTRAFAAADRAAAAIDAEQFDSIEQPQPLTEGVWGESTVGGAIMEHVKHDWRHLGMMESLLGLQGQPGTATR